MMKTRFTTSLNRLPGLLAGLCMAISASAASQAPGADFHAVGHEPGWQLNINHKKKLLNFTTGEGTVSYHYVKFGPDLRRGNVNAITYRVVDNDHHMDAVILEKFCQDSMSGRAYGAVVVVHLDGKEYGGCGEAVVERSLDSW